MGNNEVKIGKYKHYKGDIVEVIGKALHSETQEEFVIYKHITGKRTDVVRPGDILTITEHRDGVAFNIESKEESIFPVAVLAQSIA